MMNEERFRTAVFDALCACLDLDSGSAEAAALIHEAYAVPENAPRPPLSRNVIYWTVLQDPSPDPAPVEVAAERRAGRNTNVVYTTLKYQLIIVCYGPASGAHARRIRSMLYLDGAGFPRRILRAAGIYPVPDPPQPALLHEEEGSLWRKRADLTVSLRIRDEQCCRAAESVSAAPGIIIRR